MRRLENHVSGVPLKELHKKRGVSPQHHLFSWSCPVWLVKLGAELKKMEHLVQFVPKNSQ